MKTTHQYKVPGTGFPVHPVDLLHQIEARVAPFRALAWASLDLHDVLDGGSSISAEPEIPRDLARSLDVLADEIREAREAAEEWFHQHEPAGAR